MASWVDVQAGRLLARSNWDRYTPRVRIAWAAVCWLVGLTATLIVLAILNADVLFSVAWTVAVQSWLAIMLAANVRKSKGLMKATIWVGLGVVFLPILLVPVSVAVGRITSPHASLALLPAWPSEPGHFSETYMTLSIRGQGSLCAHRAAIAYL